MTPNRLSVAWTTGLPGLVSLPRSLCGLRDASNSSRCPLPGARRDAPSADRPPGTGAVPDFAVLRIPTSDWRSGPAAELPNRSIGQKTSQQVHPSACHGYSNEGTHSVSVDDLQNQDSQASCAPPSLPRSNRQARAPLAAAMREYGATLPRTHSDTKSVGLLTATIVRLKCSLHSITFVDSSVSIHTAQGMAERVGFEPTDRVNDQRFSRPPRSTTLAPLLLSNTNLQVQPTRTGGEGGIRTHGRVPPTHAFQACTFSHSVTSPYFRIYIKYCAAARQKSFLATVDFLLASLRGRLPVDDSSEHPGPSFPAIRRSLLWDPLLRRPAGVCGSAPRRRRTWHRARVLQRGCTRIVANLRFDARPLAAQESRRGRVDLCPSPFDCVHGSTPHRCREQPRLQPAPRRALPPSAPRVLLPTSSAHRSSADLQTGAADERPIVAHLRTSVNNQSSLPMQVTSSALQAADHTLRCRVGSPP